MKELILYIFRALGTAARRKVITTLNEELSSDKTKGFLLNGLDKLLERVNPSKEKMNQIFSGLFALLLTAIKNNLTVDVADIVHDKRELGDPLNLTKVTGDSATSKKKGNRILLSNKAGSTDINKKISKAIKEKVKNKPSVNKTTAIKKETIQVVKNGRLKIKNILKALKTVTGKDVKLKAPLFLKKLIGDVNSESNYIMGLNDYQAITGDVAMALSVAPTFLKRLAHIGKNVETEADKLSLIIEEPKYFQDLSKPIFLGDANVQAVTNKTTIEAPNVLINGWLPQKLTRNQKTEVYKLLRDASHTISEMLADLEASNALILTEKNFNLQHGKSNVKPVLNLRTPASAIEITGDFNKRMAKKTAKLEKRLEKIAQRKPGDLTKRNKKLVMKAVKGIGMPLTSIASSLVPGGSNVLSLAKNLGKKMPTLARGLGALRKASKPLQLMKKATQFMNKNKLLGRAKAIGTNFIQDQISQNNLDDIATKLKGGLGQSLLRGAKEIKSFISPFTKNVTNGNSYQNENEPSFQNLEIDWQKIVGITEQVLPQIQEALADGSINSDEIETFLSSYLEASDIAAMMPLINQALGLSDPTQEQIDNAEGDDQYELDSTTEEPVDYSDYYNEEQFMTGDVETLIQQVSGDKKVNPNLNLKSKRGFSQHFSKRSEIKQISLQTVVNSFEASFLAYKNFLISKNALQALDTVTKLENFVMAFVNSALLDEKTDNNVNKSLTALVSGDALADSSDFGLFDTDYDLLTGDSMWTKGVSKLKKSAGDIALSPNFTNSNAYAQKFFQGALNVTDAQLKRNKPTMLTNAADAIAGFSGMPWLSKVITPILNTTEEMIGTGIAGVQNLYDGTAMNPTDLNATKGKSLKKRKPITGKRTPITTPIDDESDNNNGTDDITDVEEDDIFNNDEDDDLVIIEDDTDDNDDDNDTDDDSRSDDDERDDYLDPDDDSNDDNDTDDSDEEIDWDDLDYDDDDDNDGDDTENNDDDSDDNSNSDDDNSEDRRVALTYRIIE